MWDRVVVEIAGFAVRGDVLTEQRVATLDRRNGAENFHLAEMNIAAGRDKVHCTFSSRISSAAKETGRSIVKMLSTWRRSDSTG